MLEIPFKPNRLTWQYFKRSQVCSTTYFFSLIINQTSHDATPERPLQSQSSEMKSINWIISFTFQWFHQFSAFLAALRRFKTPNIFLYQSNTIAVEQCRSSPSLFHLRADLIQQPETKSRARLSQCLETRKTLIAETVQMGSLFSAEEV